MLTELLLTSVTTYVQKPVVDPLIANPGVCKKADCMYLVTGEAS